MRELDIGPFLSWIELDPEQQQLLLTCSNDELAGLMGQFRLNAQAMSWVADVRTFDGLDVSHPDLHLPEFE